MQERYKNTEQALNKMHKWNNIEIIKTKQNL